MDSVSLITLLTVLCGTLLISTGTLAFMLLGKNDLLRQLQSAHDKLMRSFNDIDEQAKLIVKTDLELNRAQEELDKRLNGLNALQRTSRQINQALNELEIFQKLQAGLFEDLGFSKVLIAINDDKGERRMRTSFGFPDDKIRQVLATSNQDEILKTLLKNTQTVSSINTSRKNKEKIIHVFESEHFILAPIVTQSGSIGFVFVGNRYTAQPVTQGDEELVTILAGQIGQALENAQLFEKVFRSSQDLELKVKERTKQLASALEQVEDISRKKSEFISAVSHELRTPLTSIKGYASILIAGKIGDLPDAVKERLAKINLHSDNLVSLINNLLDIARIESGRIEMKFAPYKVKQVVDNIADLLAPQMKDKNVHLVVDIPANATDMYIDLSHADRVFINLMSNAVKFTPSGGTITLAALPVMERGYITFFVKDTGIGIPENDLNKLFSEFYRVDNEINQNVKGTGLGLVLAKNIVHAHRGKIWIESRVGVGTTFYFTLPSTQQAFEESIKKNSLN